MFLRGSKLYQLGTETDYKPFNKHLMIGPKGDGEFRYPETPNVSQGKAKGNIEVEGKQNSLFHEGPRGTLRSSGNETHCFPRGRGEH